MSRYISDDSICSCFSDSESSSYESGSSFSDFGPPPRRPAPRAIEMGRDDRRNGFEHRNRDMSPIRPIRRNGLGDRDRGRGFSYDSSSDDYYSGPDDDRRQSSGRRDRSPPGRDTRRDAVGGRRYPRDTRDPRDRRGQQLGERGPRGAERAPVRDDRDPSWVRTSSLEPDQPRRAGGRDRSPRREDRRGGRTGGRERSIGRDDRRRGNDGGRDRSRDRHDARRDRR